MRVEPYEREPTFQRAMKLVAIMYKATQDFPQEEKSGLAAAIRRTVTAIPAKIADAHGQVETAAAIKAFEGAQSMLRELQTSLQIAGLLGIMSRFRIARLRSKCQRLSDALDVCIVRCEDQREDDAVIVAEAA